MKEDEKKELAGRFTAYRARIARNEDTSEVQSTAHSKITGGKCTDTGFIMDSDCTFPITSTAVAKVLGAEIKPLTRSLEIIDASGKIMDIIDHPHVYRQQSVGRKKVSGSRRRGK